MSEPPSSFLCLLSPVTLQVISLPVGSGKFLWYMSNNVAVLLDGYGKVVMKYFNLAVSPCLWGI